MSVGILCGPIRDTELLTCPFTKSVDLAGWWAPRHKINKEYIDRYRDLKTPSEPVEDFEDRGLLYRV